MTKPRATVVIRAKNEARHIEEVLRRVLDQRGVDFEVIVVDSGSTDGTLDILSKFPIRLLGLDPDDFSFGRALNMGFAAASSPFCVSLSAHALPLDRDWLKNILAPFEDEEVCAVVGKQLPRPDCNPFDRRGLLRHYGTEMRYLHRDSLPTYSNANAAVRRADWEKLPFDEELPFSEDLQWSFRMLRLGRRLVYQPCAAAYHSHNEGARGLFQRFYNESLAHGELGHRQDRYRLSRLLWDAGAGSLYDYGTVAKDRSAIRWALFAPLRRGAINLGRYCGSRRLPQTGRRGPVAQVLLRVSLLILGKINRVLGGLAPLMVKMTRKHPSAIHPKHLLKNNDSHTWYGEYIQGVERVLDLGCDRGMHTLFASRFAVQVVGTDRNPRALDVANFNAKWEGRGNITYMLAGAEEGMPFKDASFDVVFAFDIIEHLDNRQGFLKEIRRVLMPEGLLLLSAPNSETGFKKLKREAGLPFFSDPDHRIEYTRQELEEECRAGGFVCRRVQAITLDTPFHGIIDFLGGISLSLYAWLDRIKRRAVVGTASDSTGFRMVLARAESNPDS